jgi:hypothetical protein
MREALRDKSRDTVAASLAAAGIQAEMVDRDLGRPEEKIRTFKLFGKSSLGLIDIRTDSPISWINVVRTKSADKHGPARYRVVFGIPDQNIPMNHEQLKLKTARKKRSHSLERSSTFPGEAKHIPYCWQRHFPRMRR